MISSTRPLQIVLIEDNKNDANIAEEMLDATGIAHELIWFNDSEKALLYFEDHEDADFVILDLKLPKMSGHRLIEIIRERGLIDKIPVIAMTGSTSPVDKSRALKNGVICYLIKPITVEEMDDMVEVLKKLLRNDRSGDGNS